jgi:thymidylate kinase
LVERLCDALDMSGVEYCHWKSNAQIERSASGKNDLDLLVRRSHVRRFEETLSALGFARAYKHGGTVPAIESFYGFDSEAGRFVHVHAHYELVLGHDATKNYRLPIEDAYLDSTRRDGFFPLPAPELELVVFVIRMVLKYCIWDEIAWSALRRRRPVLKPSERGELAHLTERADATAVTAVLREQVPYVGEALFAECVACIASDRPARKRMRTARRLEAVLEPHARHSRRIDAALRMGGRAALAVQFRIRRRPRNRFAAGGAIVGVIGGDGAGKSTAIAEIDRWLAPDFDVRMIHLGKPPWSATTWLTRATLKAAVHATESLERAIPSAPTRRVATVLTEYRPLLWFLCVARDRRRLYRGARRFAASGGLVISDRYPHERLRLMDVPQIERVAGANGGRRLVRAMARLEERYHASIAPPELLVALRLNPDIAAVRKTTEPAASVRERGAEIWNAEWGESARVVDANRPPEVVAAELKELVWSVVT